MKSAKTNDAGQKAGILSPRGRFAEFSGAGDFAAAQAPGTDVHVTGSSVDDCLDALHIGLPSAVASPVGVADLDTKGDTLSAKFTSGHCCTSLPCAVGCSHKRRLRESLYIIAGRKTKCKLFFRSFPDFFPDPFQSGARAPAPRLSARSHLR